MFNVSFHPLCIEKIKSIRAENPKDEKKFVTAIQKLQSNPYLQQAKPLKYAPKHLQGIFWRIWVGDRDDYRLVYVILKDKNLVVCLFVDKRTNIDWDNLDWSELEKRLNSLQK